MTIRTKPEWFVLAGIFLILLWTFQIYSAGLSGVFVLDDIPNLDTLGAFSHYNYWENFWLFLLEGDSGPTGRPLSLASFFLNDHAWPSEPASFIYTNILIHLLNGLLVFWFTYKLGSIVLKESTQVYYFALISSTFWLLHPFNTTTVLYVIQRMTELSATFTLMGLLFFLYGYQHLQKNSLKGLIILVLGVGMSLGLSIISKENGVLLLVYILIINCFLLRPLGAHKNNLYNYWLAVFIFIPVSLILAYLIQHLWLNGPYSTRAFTLEERLMTESRILFDYLHHILLPSNKGTGLFHDDYIVSKGIFTPWTTLPAIIGIVSLIIAIWAFRKKAPFIAFAIVWFLGGHLLESTTLSLELYFEHRNYLPMLGFLIAIAFYISQYLRVKPLYTGIGTLIILAVFSLLTFQNAKLWGNPEALVIKGYIDHPNSIRAQEAYKSFTGNQVTANEKPHQPSNAVAYSALLKLDHACRSKAITESMMLSTLETLKKHSLETAATSALIILSNAWFNGDCQSISSTTMKQFLSSLLTIKTVQKNRTFLYHCHRNLADLYLIERNLNLTMINLEKSYKLKPSVDLLITQSEILASAGLYDEALKVLIQTNALSNTWRKRFALKIRQKELDQQKNRISNFIHMRRNQKKGTLSFN